jgi:hypothetical protein
MYHRTAPTVTAMLTPAATSPDDRPEVHNTSIDDQLAETGACSQVHLQTGRTCTLKHGHHGSCDFVARQDVQGSVAAHRAADGW